MTSREILTEFGRMGEQYAADQLRRMGLSVELIGESSNYDLLIEGCIRVEIKTATLTADSRGWGSGRWQFSLRRHGLAVDEDLIILVCWDDLDDDPLASFVIPGDAIDLDLTKIDITRTDPTAYAGKWADYLESWDTVVDVVEDAPMSKPQLFRQDNTDPIPF